MGEGLRGWRGWLGAALGVALVAVDILVEPEYTTVARYWASRIVPCAVVIAALWLLARPGGLGIRWRPVQGWGYWAWASAIILGAAAVVYLGGLFARHAGWIDMRYGGTALPERDRLLQTGVYAPLLEEAIYRVALLTPLAPRIGKVATIVVGAVVFALLHIRYGVAGPANQLGGLFLCWAYLHSRSIAVPLAWHAGGNVILAYANVFAARMF